MTTNPESAPAADRPWASGATPAAGTLLESRPEVSAFPYAFRINGRSAEPLRGWAQLNDLLNLVGMTDGYSFLIVERTDGSERWAQALGHAHELVVELGLPDAPMRVTRVDSPAVELTVMSSQRTLVSAQGGDIWSAGEATTLMRAWLERAALGLEGVQLRTPDDWQEERGQH
ncbi:MAG: hypothetical protein KJ659_04290 [Actinobacteria bacterium]|nr:hypothetical protein [Actinomycetota bacterium]MBU1609605.1 hypothetical protein [Actinomycetota bacterium]MBU2315440.1 hypothetical protein [Actinomycetota bacterium]MBU2384706.1 hypothetical protein [Actinomycetota bacterium]